MTRLSRLAARLVLGALLPALAPAQTSLEDRVAALEQQLGALAAENKALREQQAKAAPAVAPGAKETKLSLGGFVQIHAEQGDSPDSRFTGIADRVYVRRARVTLKGAYGSDFAFKVESDFGANTLAASSGYRAQLTDLYVDWTRHPAAQVRLGQFKTPFGWEQLMADTANPFVERPLANDRLTVGRQIGAQLFGSLAAGRVDYAVGAFNGNGVNTTTNDNDKFMTAARLGAKAWQGRLGGRAASLGAGINAFTSDDTGSFTGRRHGLGFDAQFAAGPLGLRAEWLRNTSDPVTGATVQADGWYAAAFYDLNPAWQLAARYETFDPNTALAGNDTRTAVLGVNRRLKGNDVTVSLDYFAGRAALGGGDDRLLARFQLVF